MLVQIDDTHIINIAEILHIFVYNNGLEITFKHDVSAFISDITLNAFRGVVQARTGVEFY